MKHVKSSTLISITWMELSTSFRSRSSWISRTLNIDVTNMLTDMKSHSPIPVAVRSKAWVCGRSLAGIAGSNPAGYMVICCDCCVLSGRGSCDELIARPEGSYGVQRVCHLEISVMRRPWSARTVEP